MDYLVGFLPLVLSLLWLGRSLRLRMKGFLTFGTVTAVNGVGRSRHLSISFDAFNKKTYSITNGFFPSFILYQVGDSVPVFYDPSNPANAVMANFDTMWLMPLIFVGFGVFACIDLLK